MTEPKLFQSKHTLRWTQSVESGGWRRLNRLAILRDLYHDLHAERSSLLARGDAQEARGLLLQEAQIENLRNHPDLACISLDLVHLMNNPLPPSVSKPSPLWPPRVPESVLEIIGRNKLERSDRDWEYAMTAEACRQSCAFWLLNAQVALSQVEKWNERLKTFLWPRGHVLFVENAPQASQVINLSEWRGAWLLLLQPGIDPQKDSDSKLHFDFEGWPGQGQTPPEFQLLYSTGNPIS